MSEFIRELITSPYFAICGAILGFILGNWFHIWRDRRNEFNTAANQLASRLHSGKHHVPREAFAEFRRYLPFWRLRAYDRLVSQYRAIGVDAGEYESISRAPELSGMVPRGHKEAEQIAARIGGFRLVAEGMRQGGLADGSRDVGPFGSPIAECGPEAMRPVADRHFRR